MSETKTAESVDSTLDELRKVLDSKTISQIEDGAKEAMATSMATRREFIETMYYLERTGRWKENVRFREASFGTYLRDIYMLTIGTYDQERIAFIKHPLESNEFGIGTVVNARKRCPALEVPKVFEEIRAVQQKTGRPANHIAIGKIIEGHARPVAKNAAIIPKTELYRQVAEMKATLLEKEQKIKEMVSQIRKLKATVQKLKAK